MLNYNEMSKRIEELMKEGKTLEEALKVVAAPVVTVASTRLSSDERTKFINGLTDLQELKAHRKTAFAKVSKAKSAKKDEAIERYQAEVKMINARINEVMAEIDKAEKDWVKAREYNMEVSTRVQRFLVYVDSALEQALVKVQKDMSKAAFKAKVSLQKAEPSKWLKTLLKKELTAEELAEYMARLDKDEWARNQARKSQLVK